MDVNIGFGGSPLLDKVKIDAFGEKNRVPGLYPVAGSAMAHWPKGSEGIRLVSRNIRVRGRRKAKPSRRARSEAG